ncbi:hypothetical protein B0H10DRAFT_2438717 [Mycena sp. CBHHK59/15]|nr:hypothetical protein B0H10DRAFT_2438717 [Mycena sp. CBHHK59/15]
MEMGAAARVRGKHTAQAQGRLPGNMACSRGAMYAHEVRLFLIPWQTTSALAPNTHPTPHAYRPGCASPGRTDQSRSNVALEPETGVRVRGQSPCGRLALHQRVGNTGAAGRGGMDTESMCNWWALVFCMPCGWGWRQAREGRTSGSAEPDQLIQSQGTSRNNLETA